MRGSYLKLLENGELKKRVEQAKKILASCMLCPHSCKVDRLKGETGFCKIGQKARVASYGPHFGEERPISGKRGSGTVFFSGCNMRCVFCQNYEISHELEGIDVSSEYLAFIFLSLQEEGCHNINLVTPTHVVPQILEGVLIAAEEGLHLPIVYNCGGYESLETIRLLDGIIDIYMPDAKYSDNQIGLRLSKAKNYWDNAKEALKAMHRQVGDLAVDPLEKVAYRGLLVRHLVLPENLAGSKEIFNFLARHVSPDTVINVMDQYRPCGKAFDYPPLDRFITRKEWEQAVKWAKEAGLKILTY